MNLYNYLRSVNQQINLTDTNPQAITPFSLMDITSPAGYICIGLRLGILVLPKSLYLLSKSWLSPFNGFDN
jgi:hypothetical protein